MIALHIGERVPFHTDVKRMIFQFETNYQGDSLMGLPC